MSEQRDDDDDVRIQRRTAAPALLLLLACAVSGCPGPAPGDAAVADADGAADAMDLPDAGPLPPPPAPCPAPNEAHVPQGDGTTACTRVGALEAPASGPWPDVRTLPAPVVYVRAGATGGDGTPERPFGALGEALASTPAPATVALAAGVHTLSAPVTIDTTLTLAGVGSAAGATGSTLTGPAGQRALSVMGASARVTVTGVRIVPATPCTRDDTGVGLEVGAGAEATVRDVVVDDYGEGVHVAGGTLTANDLTARRSCTRGLGVFSGGHATVTSLLVRDGGGVGVLCAQSRLALDRALVADNANVGVGIAGSLGDGMQDAVAHAEIARNGVTGLRVERSGMGPTAVVAHVRASLLAVYDTRVVGVAGGDGIQVGPGGELALDPEIGSDAQRGHGSDVRANARAGVLTTGDTNDASAAVGRLTLTGAAVRDNRTTGIFLQAGAVAPVIGYAEIAGNAALGVAVTSRASLVQFLCNAVHDTRPAPLVTSGATLMLGDGLSMSEGTASATILRSSFANNGRFGLVLTGSDATLSGCHGDGNQYGVGAYDARLVDDGTNTISGVRPLPAMNPGVFSGSF